MTIDDILAALPPGWYLHMLHATAAPRSPRYEVCLRQHIPNATSCPITRGFGNSALDALWVAVDAIPNAELVEIEPTKVYTGPAIDPLDLLALLNLRCQPQPPDPTLKGRL